MNSQDGVLDVKKFYSKKNSRSYRQGDEISKESPNITHRCEILRKLSSSFDHKITALDLGCGTGRYFHCLWNTTNLTGIDISQYMLEGARTPIKRGEIHIDHIDLVCGDILNLDLPPASFDLIYSIGVLGEYTQFNSEICYRIFNLLKPGGKTFFTVVDFNAKILSQNLVDKVSGILYQILPRFLRQFAIKNRFLYPLQNADIEQKRRKNYLKLSALQEILKQSQFSQWKITRFMSKSHFWRGGHFECIAIK
ncbi:MAG: hypothetical protein A2V66_15760 [Ignavibacteria bacterium RBG_13_36_8]|nr:MAG: hypothetical protein A2V66_15760 [Ignavibacteria bacterium RBG_13_36_8]